MPGALRFVVVLAALVVPAACGESRQEVYMQGMKLEGDAERGPCKLLYDEKEGANVLSGDQVQSCLKMQGDALALYDRAAALGLKDLDFVRTHEQARVRLKRLEGMLRMVREMERPDYRPPAAP